jgi:hypothetical protein
MHPLRFPVLRAAAVAVLLACCWASSSLAALQVYEGFTYADGTSILGQNGGGGWSNTWNAAGSTTGITANATTPGLIYPSLPASGNKLSLAGQQNATANGTDAFIFRSLGAANSFGADGTTAWVSFIGQRTGGKSGTHGTGSTPTYERVFALSFFQGGTTSATNERWSVGELTPAAAALDTDTWSLNIFPTAEAQSSGVPIDQQSLLLVRVDYGTGLLADNAYMWVNPNLSLGEPSIGTAQASLLARNLEFDRLRVGAGGSQNTGALLAASGLFDEIRVGNSFASVIGPGLIPGDVNGDLVVDINDYNVIRNNFQSTSASRAQGDLNADGLVSFADFRIWKNNRTAGSGAGDVFLDGPVPEPTAIVLLLIGMMSFGGRRFVSR